MKPRLPPPTAIVAFWRAAGYSRWYKADPSFDRLVKLRLGHVQAAAAAGGLDDWAALPIGALALVLLLDQAPRNLFRGTPRAFATDAKALALAELALRRKFDRALAPPMRRFFYLPFMHAENLAAQQRCLALMQDDGDPDSIRYAQIHLDIIERFGRFPHRNVILGRDSTEDEDRYLAEGGFRG